jgi:periplasmic protein TonB
VSALADMLGTRERLVTTLTLAAALHGILVLGVSFGTGGSNQVTPTLDVVLVSDELREAEANPTARYLAQRAQHGAGNAQIGETSTPEVSAAVPAAGSVQTQGDDAEVLRTSSPQPDIVYAGAPAPTVQVLAEERAPLDDSRPTPGRGTRDELRLLGDTRTGQWLSPDARASDLAPYLDRWRRRVERLGTLNYPAAARAGNAHPPVIEVALSDQGALLEARIQQSSGDPALDAAALQILHLASPFGSFPPVLARKYRSLRFAYQWEFSVNSATEATPSP